MSDCRHPPKGCFSGNFPCLLQRNNVARWQPISRTTSAAVRRRSRESIRFQTFWKSDRHLTGNAASGCLSANSSCRGGGAISTVRRRGAVLTAMGWSFSRSPAFLRHIFRVSSVTQDPRNARIHLDTDVARERSANCRCNIRIWVGGRRGAAGGGSSSSRVQMRGLSDQRGRTRRPRHSWGTAWTSRPLIRVIQPFESPKMIVVDGRSRRENVQASVNDRRASSKA